MAGIRRVRRVREVDPAVEATRPMYYDQEVVEDETVGPAPVVDAAPVVERREVRTVRQAPAGRRVVRQDYVEDTVDPYYLRAANWRKIQSIVWTIIGLIEALLAIRVILRLIDANPANGFVNFVYSLSGAFVAPFNGIVGEPASGGAVLEINTLLAMLVYLILGWVVLKLVALFYNVTEPPEVP